MSNSLKSLPEWIGRSLYMKNIKGYIPPEVIAMVSGSSIGTQKKYYDKGIWYKQDNSGYEGRAEYLVSIVLKYSNLSDYVEYECCTINGINGCCSKCFLKENESYISLQRLYDVFHGGQLSERIRIFDSVSDRIDFVVDFIMEHTDLDIREYLGKLLTLDMLILNNDRHFNNIGIIADTGNDTYRPAPVFDNGNSLLSSMVLFPFEMPMEQCVDSVIGQPFSANLERQAAELGFGLKIDYDGLKEELSKEPSSRALKVLLLQMDRYEHILSLANR